MRAGTVALALVLLLTSTCTFERRSPDDQETGRVERPRFGPASPSRASEARGEDAAGDVEAAARVLAAFQADRRAGDAAGARTRLAPEAVLLREGRSVEWRDDGPAADSLLAPGSGLDRPRRSVDGRRLGGDVLFVLRYPSSGPGAGGVRETLLLTPGDDGGWRVLLLHRSGAP